MAAGATLFSLPSVISFWSLVSIAVAGAGMGATGEAAPDTAVVSALARRLRRQPDRPIYPACPPCPRPHPAPGLRGRSRSAGDVAGRSRRWSADAAAVGAGAGEDVVLAEFLPASAPCATTRGRPGPPCPACRPCPRPRPALGGSGRAASASRVPVADAAVGKPAVFAGTAHTAAGGWLSSAAAGEPTGRAAPARTIARPTGAASDSGPGRSRRRAPSCPRPSLRGRNRDRRRGSRTRSRGFDRAVAHRVRRPRRGAGVRDVGCGDRRRGGHRPCIRRRQTVKSRPIAYDLIAVARVLAVGDQAIDDRAALLDRVAELRTRWHRVQARVARWRGCGLVRSRVLGSRPGNLPRPSGPPTCRRRSASSRGDHPAPPASRRAVGPMYAIVYEVRRPGADGPPTCGPSAGHRVCRRLGLDAPSNLTISRQPCPAAAGERRKA